MDCSEAVYSNGYYDIIGSVTVPMPAIENLCQQKISNQYIIYYLNRDEVPPLSLGTYKYSNIPKCYTILDQSALEASGITRVQMQRNLQLFGEGILIGFLDTGIQYENDAFRNTDGSSRIVAIWDQSINTGPHPEGFIYGTEYTKADIDFALQQENPREFVPQRDEIGHGTMLAAIAAGSEDIQDCYTYWQDFRFGTYESIREKNYPFGCCKYRRSCFQKRRRGALPQGSYFLHSTAP